MAPPTIRPAATWRPHAGKSRGECYAVLGGSQPGVYFVLQEAKAQQKHGGKVSSFPSASQAQAFMNQNGHQPLQRGGWLSNDKKPILYSVKKPYTVSQSSSSTLSPATPRPRTTAMTTTTGHSAVRGGEQLAAQHHQQQQQQQQGHSHQKMMTPRDRGTQGSGGGRRCRRRALSNERQQQHALAQTVITIDSSPEETAGKPTVPVYKKIKREDRSNNNAKKEDGFGMDDDNDDDNSEDLDHRSNESPTKSTVGSISYDEIQQEAINAAFDGKNVFITGVAGTGKSLVTKAIVNNAKNMRLEIAACAPTGVAAVNLGSELGAQTIHSLAGVGVPQSARDFNKLLTFWTAKKWKTIEMLVIDEIGMLQADFLDWLDVFVRRARRQPLSPFGGIQLICVGDFAQLGPIPGENSLTNRPFSPTDPRADCFLNVKQCAAYAFQTAFWREAQFHHVHLRKVYRQSDLQFVQSLMDVRQAKADTEPVRRLVEQCESPLEEREGLKIPEGIKPTILYCTNKNVDKENYDNLAKLQTEYKAFQATDTVEVGADVSGGGAQTVRSILQQNNFFQQCSASKVVHLKVGAQVMLLQNLDIQNGLVNGSRGVVEKFALCPVVRDQGKSGEERLIGPGDLDKFPGCTFEQIKFNQKAEFDGKVWRVCRKEKFPLVRFMNGTTRIIVPEVFERVLFRQGKCIRKQLPLRLAWALTVHKAQGSTLDLVICDLRGCFCAGQAYVALSRARCMLGLQIKNFDPRHVSTDPLVDSFYRALDEGTMDTFLEEQAGIWWYPILKAPEWLRMFSEADHRDARENSVQFRDWLLTYRPTKGYAGWGSEHYGKSRSNATNGRG